MVSECLIPNGSLHFLEVLILVVMEDGLRDSFSLLLQQLMRRLNPWLKGKTLCLGIDIL